MFFKGSERQLMRHLIALTGARICAHEGYVFNTVDLCFMDAITKGLADRTFTTQSCSLIILSSFILPGTAHSINKVTSQMHPLFDKHQYIFLQLFVFQIDKVFFY